MVSLCKVRFLCTIFVLLTVGQSITSSEMKEYLARKKRQLDWNNGVDYQFDHIAISSNRHVRRDDDGSVDDPNTVDEEPSGIHRPEGVPGEPGVDYPILPAIPLTNFHCRGRVPGYYGDTETACQVFHICDVSGRQDSFLCPNGTIFSQKLFSCDWWYNVQCASTRQHYQLNRNLYKSSDLNLYGTPSFWNWLSEIDDEEPNTDREGPSQPDETDDEAEAREIELPIPQPLVSHQRSVNKPQNYKSFQAPSVTSRSTTPSPRPAQPTGSWLPVVASGPLETSTPKPASLIQQQPEASINQKRSPTIRESNQHSQTSATTATRTEWDNMGFLRDYQMPNFGWARESLFPVDKGTTPELSWMDIGPNGPLMPGKNDQRAVIQPSTAASTPVRPDRRRKVKTSSPQIAIDQPSPVQHFKAVQQAPQPIQRQKITVQPLVDQQLPKLKQQARQVQQFSNPNVVAPVHSPPINVKKQQTLQSFKTRPTTTPKPFTTTTTKTTTTSVPFDYYYDDDTTKANDDGETNSQKITILNKFKKSTSNKKKIATTVPAIIPTQARPITSSTKNRSARDQVSRKFSAHSSAAWLQQPKTVSQKKINQLSHLKSEKPKSGSGTGGASSRANHKKRVSGVRRGEPIYQPDQISRKRDPFAGVVMERVSVPFRPSTPLSVTSSATSTIRQPNDRSLSLSPTTAVQAGHGKNRSRSHNAYDPRLDRPYRQEHPIWKMLNWESRRV